MASLHGYGASRQLSRDALRFTPTAGTPARTRAIRIDGLARALGEAAGWERAAALAADADDDRGARRCEAAARAALHFYPGVRAILYPEV